MIVQCFHGDHSYSQEKIDEVCKEWIIYMLDCTEGDKKSGLRKMKKVGSHSLL